MNTEEKFKLITRNLEEVLTEEELRFLIDSTATPHHYIGFEISGKVHLGTGFASMLKIKDLQEAGVVTRVLLADWHTWLNKKLDGTLETARKMAREYFEEGLKAAALCVGADPDKIEFILGSELYEKLGSDYWATVINVSKATTLSRMMRSTTIMGRRESEISDAAMLIYPAMQSADVFVMHNTIVHAGTDQRNVHIVARDSSKSLGFPKPIALHHHLLQGLVKPNLEDIDEIMNNETGEDNAKEAVKLAFKMSKSKPDSAVFIHDSEDEIRRKVNNAYAPEGVVEFNPILDWLKYLVFYNNSASQGLTLQIKRDERWGGDLSYSSYEELERDYTEKKLHPQDLKGAVAEWLIEKLEPARKYFEDPKRKQALEEIERLTVKN